MAVMFPASQTDNFLLLSIDSADDVMAIKQLWDDYSRLPGLLNATTQERATGKGYTYDPITRSFYSPSGRRISDKQLRAAVKRVSAEASKRARKETSQLIAGTIILAVWYQRVRSLFKALYKTIWLLGIGGFLFDDDTERNLFYLFMLTQFGYLDNFAQQIESGEQLLNGTALSRTGLYAGWGNSEWQNIRLANAKQDGYTEGRRVLGMNENHCTTGDRPGCIELAALDWVPIDQVVPLGDAQCYTNCLCHIIFR